MHCRKNRFEKSHFQHVSGWLLLSHEQLPQRQPTRYTGWPNMNRSPQIFLTNLVSDTLSIAYSDVLFDADSESLLVFYSRAKIEPIRDLLPQGILLLTYVQSARTFIPQFMKRAASSSSELFMCLSRVRLLQDQC